MVEAGGVEPEATNKSSLSYPCQESLDSGQENTEDIQYQNDTNYSKIDNGTVTGQQKTSAGHPKSIAGTEQEHNRNITKTELLTNFPPDLLTVTESWKTLPNPIKQGIVAMINATNHKS